MSEEQILSSCPLCKAKIDPMNYDWQCPVCQEWNKSSNIFENCGYCRFAPRLVRCPNCHRHIETWALMGTYSGPYMRIFTPDEFPSKILYTIEVSKIKLTNTKDIAQSDLAVIGIEGFKRIMESRFEFPEKIGHLVIHTIYENPKETFWLHCWAFKESLPKEKGEEPIGQISFRYPSESGDKPVDVKVLDVQIQ